MLPVAELRGARGTRPPTRGWVQILSISCSFWEILAKSYVGTPAESWRPHLWEILDPPLVTERFYPQPLLEKMKVIKGYCVFDVVIGILFKCAIASSILFPLS